MLRAVNPLRLLRRSIPQAGDTPIRVQSQTQRPQQTGDNNSIQSFGTTINSNNLQQMQQPIQTQYAEINLVNPINPSVVTIHSELDQSRYAEINLDNPINPSFLRNSVIDEDGNEIHLVNDTSILKTNYITTQSESENNLNTEKKLNSAIKKYPDISCITHPDALYIKIQYAHNIQENEIPLKINRIIQDLERTHNGTKNSLSTALKIDTQTKIDLVSRTTSEQVAKLVVDNENYHSLFSDEQRKRLDKTAFPEKA